MYLLLLTASLFLFCALRFGLVVFLIHILISRFWLFVIAACCCSLPDLCVVTQLFFFNFRIALIIVNNAGVVDIHIWASSWGGGVDTVSILKPKFVRSFSKSCLYSELFWSTRLREFLDTVGGLKWGPRLLDWTVLFCISYNIPIST